MPLKERDRIRLEKRERENQKAMAIIGPSLSDENLDHVREVYSAKEMWIAIKNVYERHRLLNMLSACRKFYTVTMENGEKVLSYLSRVRQLAEILK